MQKFIDLSNESTEGVTRIPSCAHRGWIATEIREQDWSVDLDDYALSEIRAMAEQMAETRLPTLLRHPDQFEIPSLVAVYRKIKAICDDGVGFAVLGLLFARRMSMIPPQKPHLNISHNPFGSIFQTISVLRRKKGLFRIVIVVFF